MPLVELEHVDASHGSLRALHDVSRRHLRVARARLVVIDPSTGVRELRAGRDGDVLDFIAWSLMNNMSYWSAFALACAIEFVGGVADAEPAMA